MLLVLVVAAGMSIEGLFGELREDSQLIKDSQPTSSNPDGQSMKPSQIWYERKKLKTLGGINSIKT